MTRRDSLPTPRIPKYRLHKPSRQAVVTISGRDFYLGPHGTDESKIEYQRIIAEWLATGSHRPRGDQLTVAELVDLHLEWASRYYVKHGEPTGQHDRVRLSLARVVELYGSTAAEDFGPIRLKAVRQGMIRDGLRRGYINSCCSAIVLCFRWGVSEELIPPHVLVSLRSVDALQPGRTEAPESRRVMPADEASIEAVLDVAPPTIAAMIRFQLTTGCRPGECMILRPRDIDRTGLVRVDGVEFKIGTDVWVYRPMRHKMEHKQQDRVILIGPAAQRVIQPFLDRDPDDFCFTPADTMEQYRARRRAARKTPIYKPRPPSRQRYNARYKKNAYRYAVSRLCIRLGVAHWSPHQLRHNAATRLEREFGWNVARVLLGHRDIKATRIYVVDDLQRAAEAARASG